MQILDKGIYTGNIIDQLHYEGVYINTIQYALESDNPGNHYHLNPHLCYLLQGNDIEKRNSKIYTRNGGDVFFYHSEEAHETVQINHFMKSLLIEFDSSFLKKYDLEEAKLEIALKKNSHIKLSMLKILKEKQILDDRNAITSIQMHILNLCSISEYSNKKAPEWLTKVEELLKDNWNTSISLDDLAIAVNIHPVTISKYFAKFHKETLSEYMRKIKVEHSLPLIKNSNKTLTEIAHYCSFADQSHFIRCFKDATNYLPKDFRKL